MSSGVRAKHMDFENRMFPNPRLLNVTAQSARYKVY